ncbi:hypothetical protein LEN26_000331 [Aphanomyces euteiches]|nr:hypothetical protein AeMF1_005291 [Aphanomyces euteiches]KAH9163813.1 hypothetical protein LEN26_000331 [Aphanomyces euteiches]KAH9192188.1 hypothetical protein AeNC1_005842 [Aphanomyces euteiches]
MPLKSSERSSLLQASDGASISLQCRVQRTKSGTETEETHLWIDISLWNLLDTMHSKEPNAKIVLASDVIVSHLSVEEKRSYLLERIQSIRLQQAARVSFGRRSSVVSIHGLHDDIPKSNEVTNTQNDAAPMRLSLSPLRKFTDKA